MKQVLGCIRRADARFALISKNDIICIGVSGGKDSLALVKGLALYRQFCKKNYELHAVAVDLGFPCDFSAVSAFCSHLSVPFHRVETDIGPLVFETRQEKNPCSLCATMRRGALNRRAAELGCNKVALGHNREDAIETLMMSLLFESRLHTFAPSTYLTRSQLTVIRPLVTCPEQHLKSIARRYALPVMESPCPAAGKTKRQDMKELFALLEKQIPGVRGRVLQALMNTAQYGLWPPAHDPQDESFI